MTFLESDVIKMEEIRCMLVCLLELKHLCPGHFVSGDEDDQNFCELVLH